MLRKLRSLFTIQRSGIALRCSFCGRSDQEVGKLIAGPHPSAICNDCVHECSKLVELELESPVDSSGTVDERMAGWGELLARTAIRIARSCDNLDDSSYEMNIQILKDHFQKVVSELAKRKEP